ncbi:MAG: DUF3990 domain-containing protein [Firmicutes bacterium]|nr:DUF3990 domain-containing protein [Bacillota bacterium]
MDYNFSEDLKAIRALLNLTQNELAEAVGVGQITISRSESKVTKPSIQLLKQVYSFAYRKKIELNKLKQMFWLDNINTDHKLLFHGSKSGIEGEISPTKGRANNDFGRGFYTGENYEQSVSFTSNFEKSCIYFLDFDESNLVCKKYNVNQEWMLTIAYYRGRLNQYKDHPVIKKMVEDSKNCDYIIAPIADNRMFQIINSFIDGEITDEQCKHCLAATNLGNQYILISEKAIRQVKMVERCFVCDEEREHYKKIRSQDVKTGDDKVKLARIKYRGQGLYIDEILK